MEKGGPFIDVVCRTRYIGHDCRSIGHGVAFEGSEQLSVWTSRTSVSFDFVLHLDIPFDNLVILSNVMYIRLI